MTRHKDYTGHLVWKIEILGPPEHCYPPEGSGVELLSVQRDGVDYEVSEADEAKIIEWIECNAEPPQKEWDH